jgi:hypothetical protein
MLSRLRSYLPDSERFTWPYGWLYIAGYAVYGLLIWHLNASYIFYMPAASFLNYESYYQGALKCRGNIQPPLPVQLRGVSGAPWWLF